MICVWLLWYSYFQFSGLNSATAFPCLQPYSGVKCHYLSLILNNINKIQKSYRLLRLYWGLLTYNQFLQRDWMNCMYTYAKILGCEEWDRYLWKTVGMNPGFVLCFLLRISLYGFLVKWLLHKYILLMIRLNTVHTLSSPNW